MNVEKVSAECGQGHIRIAAKREKEKAAKRETL